MQEKIKTLLPSLRRFAFSLTGNMADADDLMQGTVERLLSKPVPDDIPIMAWTFRVCRNLWIDEYRSREIRRAATFKPELQEQAATDEDSVVSNISLTVISKAMNELPMQHREVLGLVAVQGLSYQDAAAILSVPTGTIMSRLARARSKLVTVLGLDQGVTV